MFCPVGIWSRSLSIESRDHGGAANVDRRRLCRDRNRFLSVADLHLGVHSRAEFRLQLHTLAPHGLESRQRKGDDVHSRTQIDNAVLSRVIRRRGFHPFDERVACCVDCDARHHGASRVLDHTHDCGLSQRETRDRRNRDNRREDDQDESHCWGPPCRGDGCTRLVWCQGSKGFISILPVLPCAPRSGCCGSPGSPRGTRTRTPAPDRSSSAGSRTSTAASTWTDHPT